MRSKAGLSILGAALMAGSPAQAGTVQREAAGALPDGTAIEVVTLTGANGVSARILTYGATLQSLAGPDREGNVADVTLGNDTLEGYVETPAYLGVTVGRYANRIAGARFTLDGREYRLPANDGTVTLHGGTQGFDKRPWRIVSTEDGPAASVTLALTSPDGDQGYPGTLETHVTYSLDDAGALTISFQATTDRPTVANMTNHALFNLAGVGSTDSVLDHRLTIAASAITPVDAVLIPTGERRPVDGTPFDFRTPRPIGARIRDARDPQIVVGRGYDHNFVLDKGLTAEPAFAARLEHAGSGRVLEVWTTEPGLQVYTGNFIDGTMVGKADQLYRMGDGIAMEPQKFPDTPNRPAFGSARLDPGQTYRHVMIYKLTVAR